MRELRWGTGEEERGTATDRQKESFVVDEKESGGWNLENWRKKEGEWELGNCWERKLSFREHLSHCTDLRKS